MEQAMCEEKKNGKKTKGFSCFDVDGITEMMKGCFPDDAGFAACLSRMNGNWEKSCGQKANDASPKDRHGCCE